MWSTKIGFFDRNFVYYGKTDRALATRIEERRRAVRVCDSNSKMAQHANQFGHSIDLTEPPLSTRCVITTRADSSLRPGILRQTELRAMNILTFRKFIGRSRNLLSREVIVSLRIVSIVRKKCEPSDKHLLIMCLFKPTKAEDFPPKLFFFF